VVSRKKCYEFFVSEFLTSTILDTIALGREIKKINDRGSRRKNMKLAINETENWQIKKILRQK
jgi:hypothetical protein